MLELLQVSIRAEDLPAWAFYAVLALELLSILVGLFIAYTAYQGYRRNDSRPMLFIAIGFVLVLGGPTILAAIFLTLPVNPLVVAFLTQLFEVAGLVSILYALRM